MGAKAAKKDDGDDRKCEEFFGKYKKKCGLEGIKISDIIKTKYDDEYMGNDENITKVSSNYTFLS